MLRHIDPPVHPRVRPPRRLPWPHARIWPTGLTMPGLVCRRPDVVQCLSQTMPSSTDLAQVPVLELGGSGWYLQGWLDCWRRRSRNRKRLWKEIVSSNVLQDISILKPCWLLHVVAVAAHTGCRQRVFCSCKLSFN